jgi:1,2-phenylacetyl-CoA epoxidase PaaB subunit
MLEIVEINESIIAQTSLLEFVKSFWVLERKNKYILRYNYKGCYMIKRPRTFKKIYGILKRKAHQTEQSIVAVSSSG